MITADLLAQIAAIVIPAFLTFLAGRKFPPKPVDPKPVDPTQPAQPVIRPIGQGGILDLLGILASQILTNKDTSPEQKTTAFAQIVQAASTLEKK